MESNRNASARRWSAVASIALVAGAVLVAVIASGAASAQTEANTSPPTISGNPRRRPDADRDLRNVVRNDDRIHLRLVPLRHERRQLRYGRCTDWLRPGLPGRFRGRRPHAPRSRDRGGLGRRPGPVGADRGRRCELRPRAHVRSGRDGLGRRGPDAHDDERRLVEHARRSHSRTSGSGAAPTAGRRTDRTAPRCRARPGRRTSSATMTSGIGCARE